MRLNRYQVVVLLYAVLFAAGSAFSEELVLREGLEGYAGASDASIYEDQPNNANGGHPFIYCGATGTSVRRALIRFDLELIPPGSTIEAVALRLVVDRSGPSASPQDIYSLHRLNAAWGEGEVNSPDPGGNGRLAGPGDATWLSNFHQETQWATPGGDYQDAASAQDSVPASVGSEALFSSEGMIDDVQAWVDDPASNFGWILIGDESGDRNARRFVSAEGSIEDRRPTLRIQYEPSTAVKNWNLY